ADDRGSPGTDLPQEASPCITGYLGCGLLNCSVDIDLGKPQAAPRITSHALPLFELKDGRGCQPRAGSYPGPLVGNTEPVSGHVRTTGLGTKRRSWVSHWLPAARGTRTVRVARNRMRGRAWVLRPVTPEVAGSSPVLPLSACPMVARLMQP